MSNTTSCPVVTGVGRSYLRLSLAPDIGPVRLRRLVAHFGSVEAVLGASAAALERVQGIGPKSSASILASRNNEEVERAIVRAAELGLQIVCYEDPHYPPQLVHVHDPPMCLYVRGRLESADALAVAIVGTRRCSQYGRDQATRLGALLAGAGLVVVSGLARGIDGCAHHGALHAGGRTIAVLGNGLSTIYPPEHARLADQIEASGAVVTEVAIDHPPDAKNFPRRNRIIAGMSLGVIVVEAGKRSGALITARLATEYNREVFAIPGPVDRPDVSAGTNGLIRDSHAKLITCLEDVLDELPDVQIGAGPVESLEGPVSTTEALVARLEPEQQLVLLALASGASCPDEVAEQAKMPLSRVMPVLTGLEIKGHVRSLPGGRFERRSG